MDTCIRLMLAIFRRKTAILQYPYRICGSYKAHKEAVLSSSDEYKVHVGRYCGKRQGSDARVAPLFTTPGTAKTSTSLEKSAICNFCERQRLPVHHGLNLNPCTFA